MNRALLSIALAAGMASAVFAQDIVKLRNGKTVAGKVVVTDSDKEGFTIERWDSGGSLYIKWTQIPEDEKLRLLNKTNEAAVPSSVGDTLDGIRIITASREIIGVVKSEDAQQVLVKTASSPTPVPVPKAAILKRDDLKINETEAYSAEEMLAKRAEGVSDSDFPKLVEVGKFAQALKLLQQAKDYYTKAAAIDEAKKSEVEPLLTAVTTLIREAEAQAALAAVKKLADDTLYEKAIEAAKKFLDTYGDTKTGQENKSLLADIEKEAKEYEANRAKILEAKVPEAWRSIRSSLLSEYSNASKFKCGEARSNAGKMDVEIAKKIAEKFRCTADEAEAFWQKREKKPRTVNMGTGSWIVIGGQDGGLDYSGGDPTQGKDGNPVDDFMNRFGGNRGGNNKGQPQKKLVWGQPLQTSEQWWSAASGSNRRDFLEGFYALNSALVERDEPVNKDCRHCKAQGTIKVTRNAKQLDAICPLCHGAKYEQSVTYK
jgi:tetratricopeptide (TPR) repeat protein